MEGMLAVIIYSNLYAASSLHQHFLRAHIEENRFFSLPFGHSRLWVTISASMHKIQLNEFVEEHIGNCSVFLPCELHTT